MMKRVIILLIASLLTNTGIGLLNFSLVFYMKDAFNSTPSEIGWLSSLWAFSYLTGCFLLHQISKRIGAQLSIAVACFGMGLTALMMLFSPSVTLIFVLYSMFGFLTALFWPPLMGLISEGVEGAGLNKRMGFFNLSWSTGLVLSPYIAGLLLEINLSYPFKAAAGIYSLLFIGLIFMPVLFPMKSQTELTDVNNGNRMDNSTSIRFIAWLGNYSGYMVLGILIFVFPLYARSELHFSESSIGLLLLFRALFSTFVFVLTGKFVFWHFKVGYAVLGQILLVVFLLTIPFLESWNTIAGGLSFFGIIFAAQYSSSIFHGVSGSINREKRMAIHEAVLTMGLITGAIGGGEIYQRWGIFSAFQSVGVLTVIILIIQLVIILYQRKARSTSVKNIHT
jgi:MFS family permease